ncbi:hypothetical protein U9M48_041629 [Paspalum notatum var. saurae]|uniref:Uncharacterized protein n=1 Tax=Paspalum notatum var. saurae TaxID=547442 RepID=A0AAQ3UPN8_PASNO
MAAPSADPTGKHGFIKRLGAGIGNQAAVFSLTTMHGLGVLHLAASQGHLEVCRYLVEELGGDPNITADGRSFRNSLLFNLSANRPLSHI